MEDCYAMGKDKVSIMHVMAFAAPYQGNFIRSLLSLEKKMAGVSLESIYVFPEAARLHGWVHELIASGRKVHFFPEGYRDLRIHSRLLSDLIRRENVRVLHTHFWPPKYAMVVKYIEWRHADVKTIWHHHNQYGVRSSSAFMRFIKKSVLDTGASGGWHIGVSNAVTAGLVACGFDGQRVFTVRNAIDFSRFFSRSANVREELDIDPHATVVLMFGYDFFGKGVDVAIRAVSDLAQRENIILAVVVTANIEHVELEISRLHGTIPSWIKLLPPREDVKGYYAMADIFLSSSREEGFCYSLVEAAYCGCMLIASDIPGQNELKIPFTLEYPAADHLALRRCIVTAKARTQEEVQKIRDEQKEYVVSEFDLAQWGGQIVDIYRKLLGMALAAS